MAVPRVRLVALTVVILLSGCADQSRHPANPIFSGSPADPQVPERTWEDGVWSALGAEELWTHGAATDTTFLVGLKPPGGARGVWRERILVQSYDVVAGLRAMAAVGAEVVGRDPVLPLFRVRMPTAHVLERVRGLAFVDYVEPVVAPVVAGAVPGTALMSSSSGGSSPGCSEPTSFTEFAGQSPEGDLIPWSHPYNNIGSAWRRSRGDGIRVALLDTGVDAWQPQLTTRFNINPSGSRQIWYAYASPSGRSPAWTDDCGHGTRMAGVIAAPQDGQNIVGTAPLADLISVRVAASVAVFDAGKIIEGIHIAMDPARPAHIIAMAFGTTSTFSSLSDVIRYYYHRRDASGGRNGPLFIAAAGTTGPAFLEPVPNYNVLYPAELEEVIAVTGVNPDGQRNSWSHYGLETELAGYVRQGTNGVPGLYPSGPDVTGLDASSGATASVTGIAALVWARYPALTNVELRYHLRYSTNGYPNHRDEVGFGTIFAYKAVGGFVGAGISGPTSATPNSTATFTAATVGDGPFAYRWSNGATSRSATYSVGQYGFWLSVQVTDLYENVTREAIHRVEVGGDGGSDPGCDPNLDPRCPA